jgi:hypothetical protein
MEAEHRCTDPAHAEFDFWLGEWQLTWPAQQTGGDPGNEAKGTNRIERVMGGCVVEENFSMGDGTFSGRSLSVYDSQQGLWRQTWVDNSGSYLLFTGHFGQGRMILQTEPVVKDDEMVMNRMVFREIEDDSLRWDWQRSRDGGDSWTDLWNIRYRRTAS